VLFRVMMEYRYRRTRYWLRGLGVEILTPSRGEFVIGDIPALTVRKGMPHAGVNSGVGYAVADAIILPIAPDFLLRVVDGPSRYAQADSEEVAELNAWQVRGAFSHVYLRPRKRPGTRHPVRGQAQPLPGGLPRLLPGLPDAGQKVNSPLPCPDPKRCMPRGRRTDPARRRRAARRAPRGRRGGVTTADRGRMACPGYPARLWPPSCQLVPPICDAARGPMLPQCHARIPGRGVQVPWMYLWMYLAGDQAWC
jgi:hypothetical protein